MDGFEVAEFDELFKKFELSKKDFFAQIESMSTGLYELIKNKNKKDCKVRIHLF